jgi:hypothetical protein
VKEAFVLKRQIKRDFLRINDSIKVISGLQLYIYTL